MRNLISNPNLFRLFVVLSMVCYGLGTYLDAFSVFANEDEMRLLQYDGYGALLPVKSLFFLMGDFILWFIAYVGLFFFKTWAKPFFTLFYIITVISWPFSGYYISLPLESFMWTASSVFDGVIFAMIYSEAINKKVNKILVFSALIVYLLWAFSDSAIELYFPELLSEFDHYLLYYCGYGAKFCVYGGWYDWIWDGASIIAYIGLFFSRAWAKHLLLCVVIAYLFSGLFSGVSVTFYLTSIFGITSLFDGILLAIAYKLTGDVKVCSV